VHPSFLSIDLFCAELALKILELSQCSLVHNCLCHFILGISLTYTFPKVLVHQRLPNRLEFDLTVLAVCCSGRRPYYFLLLVCISLVSWALDTGALQVDSNNSNDEFLFLSVK